MSAFASGTLPAAGLMAELLLLVASLFIALAMARRAGTDAGHSYVQERTIEAQKALIVAERARSEELLRGEVAHQVAERSRQLGAVLSRSDFTLDVRRLEVSERFAERYRIAKLLGAGGMGAVYEVERSRTVPGWR